MAERRSTARQSRVTPIAYRIVVESERFNRPPLTGTVEEVLSLHPPRYRVRWDSGRRSQLTPASGAAQIVTVATPKGGDTMSQTLPERRSETAPERWEPFTELDQMTDRMRRMLEQTFGRFGAPVRPGAATGWVPFVDIEEQDDAYVVEADLPGIKREDVNIEIVGNELMITGELKEPERKGIVRRSTRRTGRFEYRVALPEQVDADSVEAKLTDGVLTLRVPKSQRAQRRKVEISS